VAERNIRFLRRQFKEFEQRGGLLYSQALLMEDESHVLQY
jgi:hypothetical protein